MQQPSITLISTSEEDQRFIASLASARGFSFRKVDNLEALEALLKEYSRKPPAEQKNQLFFWALDIPDSHAIGEALKLYISGPQLFVLADQPIANHRPLLKGAPLVQQFILRRYPTPALQVLGHLVQCSLDPNPVGLSPYFPDGAESQTLKLAKSGHRKAAVDAFQNFFLKKGIPERLASKVAQAVDELLLNAIFHAPHNPAGQPVRKYLKRTAEFDLAGPEVVDLEFRATEEYLGVCVTDHFGTLTRDSAIRLFQKDYRSTNYTPVPGPDGPTGAGLGINGVLELGLSLLFVSKARVRTDAMLFLPVSTSHKKFREGFQFGAFLGGMKEKADG